MKTVLNLKVENYNIVISEKEQVVTSFNQTSIKIGYNWAVYLNDKLEVFCTIIYDKNIYSPENVARNGIFFIANKEKTSKLRFSKSDELLAKYL
jgi:hypothetical protein